MAHQVKVLLKLNYVTNKDYSYSHLGIPVHFNTGLGGSKATKIEGEQNLKHWPKGRCYE